MKKLFVLIAALFIAESIFAKSNYIDVPGRNEVTLVGRINFTTDVDRQWFYDAIEFPEENRNYKDIYIMPFCTKKYVIAEENENYFIKTVEAKEIENFEKQAWSVNGDYFFVQYELNDYRTVYLSTITVLLGASYNLPILLPLNIKVQIPEDEQFVYIGDFTFETSGFAFELLNIEVNDDIESAQAALNEVTKKEYSLCRGNIEAVTEEDNQKLKWYYYTPMTRFIGWYNKMKDYLVEVDSEIEEIEE